MDSKSESRIALSLTRPYGIPEIKTKLELNASLAIFVKLFDKSV